MVHVSAGTLDLSRLDLSGQWRLNLYGGNAVLTQDALTHLKNISANGQLVTDAATLDLTQVPIYGAGTLSSTNATGTTFTVADVGTGLHVIGGAGTDTLVLQGQSFSAGQRAAIFGLGSVEAIVDASGSYAAPLRRS